MKNKVAALVLAGVMSLGVTLPSMADGIVHNSVSWAGSATAGIVDTPEGIVVDSLWRCPHHAQRCLARSFGDEKGFGQNVAGFVLGWPFGMVWGVPYGFVDGLTYGRKTGWDKPFSMESFLVSEEK
jgi:hypothetical protein